MDIVKNLKGGRQIDNIEGFNWMSTIVVLVLLLTFFVASVYVLVSSLSDIS